MRETKESYFNDELGEITGLVETLEGASSAQEIQDTFSSLKKISESSRNSLTTGIICQCAGKMNDGYIHDNMKEEIAKSISEELFPSLFENLEKKKEKLKPQEVAKLLLSIYDTKHTGLEYNVAILLQHYTGPNFKKILEQFLKPTK